MAELVQHFINGLAAGTIYALVALGYTMVYGVLKLINFAHGDVMMVGVYTGYATASGLGANQSTFVGVTVVFLVAMGFCATIGLVVERFAYRPLREKPRLVSLITAIGVSFAISYGFQLEAKVGKYTILPGAAPKAFPTIIIPHRTFIFGNVDIASMPAEDAAAAKAGLVALKADASTTSVNLAAFERALENPDDGRYNEDEQRAFKTITDEFGDREVVVWNWQIISILIAAGLMIGLQYLVFRTRFGTAMRAVSFDHRTSALMGIPVDRVIAGTFMLGSALAAGAGILYAIKDTLVQPLMGTTVGLKAFVAAVIGGIGDVKGAVAGALLLGLVEEMVVGYGSSTWRDAVAFGFLIIVLLFKPEGLFGKVTAEKV